MYRAVTLALFVCAVHAQNVNTPDPTPFKGSVVNLSSAYAQGVTRLPFRDGSGNEIYRCEALSLQPTYTWAVTPAAGQGTLTSIVVATNVATATTVGNHGLQVGNPVKVAGSATAAVNGKFTILTVPSATTFTYADTVADATYNGAALTLATSAPRTSAAIWLIQSWTYVANNESAHQWASCAVSANSTLNFLCVCDNRATGSYQ